MTHRKLTLYNSYYVICLRISVKTERKYKTNDVVVKPDNSYTIYWRLKAYIQYIEGLRPAQFRVTARSY